MNKQELEKQIKQIDRDLFNIENGRRINDISTNKLKAVSVFCLILIVCVCLFGL